MKPREMTFRGHTSNEGIKIYNRDDAIKFAQLHPNKKALIAVTIFEPQSSELLKGYYRAVVVPAFQRAYQETGVRMSLRSTEITLRKMCEIKKQVDELCNAELIDFIEHLKQIGAEEFSIYIEDPKVL